MTTPNKAMSFPANGAAVNVWDTMPPGGVNVNFTIVDSALGGATVLNATGVAGTVTLTAAQYIPPNIGILGTLTAAVNYQIPAGVGGFWSLNNSASGAFAVTFSIAGGNAITIPANAGRVLLISDGASIAFMSAVVAAPGANTQVVVNAGGLLAANANFVFDGTNVGVAGSVTANGVISTGVLTISGTVSGAGMAALFAAPYAIGGTTPAAARFTSAYTPTNAIGNSGSAVSVNATLSNVHSVTMTAAASFAIAGMASGQTVNVQITQDSSGGRVVTWPGAWLWPGGSVPALSTAPNAVDLLVVTLVGSNYLATLGKAFAV